MSDELGFGLGDCRAMGAAEVDGIFGSILGGIKKFAAPALTWAGGAVGTMVAPGLGTAVGAKLGGFVGGKISSSGGGGGGGGGGRPAPRPVYRAAARPAPRPVVRPAPRPVARAAPMRAPARKATPAARAPRSFAQSNPTAPPAGGMSSTTKTLLAVGGGVGALGVIGALVLAGSKK